MSRWLDMLRLQSNWMLAERFQWWEENRSIDWIDGNKIELPKLGMFKVIWHRPLPEGFNIKTAIITQKADGWYITLTLKDVSVPEFTSDIEPTASRRNSAKGSQESRCGVC